jgi:hypothetical protein
MVNLEKIYTAQANAHGNIIVCRGNDVRNSYKIIGTGTYKEMLELKLKND